MTERNEQRKIAFVGTSSIGKTTLIEELKKKAERDNIRSFAFVPEAARDFFIAHRNIPQSLRFSARVQGQVQDLQWGYECEAHDTDASNIISDRSVLDAVAYTRAYGDLKGADKLLAKVRLWLPTYSRILLLNPNDVPYETDDIRQEAEEIRMQNHEAFVSLFEERQIPYELLSGTLAQRLEHVNEVLKR